MNEFTLFAQPWWVNIFIIVPFITYYFWQKDKLTISKLALAVSGLFAISFGFVEASVVIYLRTIGNNLEQAQILNNLPSNLLMIEIFREVATIIMLISVATLTVKSLRERWAIFFWTFAIWDIFYYVFLRIAIGWPLSLLTPDVLFLIPAPWFSQVWFPILASFLTIIAVLITRKSAKLIQS